MELKKRQKPASELDIKVFKAWKANPDLTQPDLANQFNISASRAHEILTRCIKKYGLLN